ncbi:MAG: hypothetical protein LBU55_03050 [Elusimicrobiota bacterium]|jgi:hypothetical protein|nr:hypothetical protein [Elusimicrobiota bacterium]
MKKMLMLCVTVFVVTLFTVSCSKEDKGGGVYTPLPTDGCTIEIYPASGSSFAINDEIQFYVITRKNGEEVIDDVTYSLKPADANNKITVTHMGILDKSGEANKKVIIFKEGQSGASAIVTIHWNIEGYLVSNTAQYFLS